MPPNANGRNIPLGHCSRTSASPPLPTADALEDSPATLRVWAEPTYARSSPTGSRVPKGRRASHMAPVSAALRDPFSVKPVTPPPALMAIPKPLLGDIGAAGPPASSPDGAGRAGGGAGSG